MSEQRPHLKTLEEIERTCVPGLVEVLRTEGIEGVRYALWNMTGWHRDYDPCLWRSNPADAVKAPAASTKEMHPLSAPEARRLLEAARGDRLEALYMLALHTGMRRGELLGLNWEDVDLDGSTIRVRRTLTRTENGRRLALG